MGGVKVIGLLYVLVIVGISTSSFKSVSDEPEGEELFVSYCGGCHLLPQPSSLPKQVWKDRVLPVMASRLGIVYPGFDPLKGLTPEEREVVAANLIIPKQPAMSTEAWKKLSTYIINGAPDQLPIDQKRFNRNKPLQQFIRKDIPLRQATPSLITGLKYNDQSNTLWIGDNYQTVSTWELGKGVMQTIKTQTPVVDFTFYKHDTYFTEIGKLFPTELSLGSYTKFANDAEHPLLTSLRRPVNVQMDDLNGDGEAEIISCNYGNKVGALSLYTKDAHTQTYVEHVLLNLPGAIRCYIQDMDGDGQKDIVALFAQGDESVYIFYQKDDLQFKAKRVLRFPPHFGTTDLVLTDFNKDGLIDIITAHGDNADHSPVLKSFHGIRIHLNGGSGKFPEKYFYPVYGATRVIAEDFDLDGDMDIALTAFFPDFEQLIEESFVYLENQGGKSGFQFTSYTQKNGMPVKSLTLEKGDIDHDGDVDILLGLFAQTPGWVPDALDQQWKSSKTGLIVFLNQAKHSGEE